MANDTQQMSVLERREQAQRYQQALNQLRHSLLGDAELEEKLVRITECVVEAFGADFCRIWTTRRGDLCEDRCLHANAEEAAHRCKDHDLCLHLLASSGRYTHIDGEGHRRVPLGCYKIGRVGSGEDEGFLSNDVANDPRIHDRVWARDLGLVSFAGYRLSDTEGQPLGVLALFSQRPIDEDEDALLLGLAHSTAQVIQTARSQRALHESRDFLQTVIDGIPEATMVIGGDYTVKLANRVAREKAGTFTAECEGVPCHQLCHRRNPRGDACGEAPCPLEEVVATKELHQVEYKRVDAAGEETVEDIVVAPIFNAAGEVDQVVYSSRDITERVRAGEVRRHLEAQIQQAQKLESLGILAGGIAHDFNNLLTGVLGNASLARMDVPSSSPAAQPLSQIETTAHRAAELCQQMLAYAGKGKFVTTQLDLSTLVEEMAQLLEVSISKTAVLKLDLARNLPAVRADPTQIRQVTMNLITNASDAMGDGSGVIAITTGTMNCDRQYLNTTHLGEELKDGTYVFLEVRDTGCGMDQETQAKMFDPFFSTKFTGRGLGMAATLGIVRGHHGAIKIYSELGSGTTTKVLLPASEQPAATPKAHNALDPSWRGSGTVLIVDDEKVIRDLGARILGRQGFEVLKAESGAQALELFRAHTEEIAVVLLDLTMPGLSGEETFRELRRIRPDVRVILSSGYNEQDAIDRFVGEGLAGFLKKPYSNADLVRKFADVLQLS